MLPLTLIVLFQLHLPLLRLVGLLHSHLQLLTTKTKQEQANVQNYIHITFDSKSVVTLSSFVLSDDMTESHLNYYTY